MPADLSNMASSHAEVSIHAAPSNGVPPQVKPSSSLESPFGPNAVSQVTPPPVGKGLNKYSAELTQSTDRGGAQAMLIASGITVDELEKPQVGICSMWWQGNPCNVHLLELGKQVAASMPSNDLVGLQYNTIGISDAITMGGQGMRMSLPSRDLIVDSIEAVSVGQSHDGTVIVPGCDKNMAASLMAAARVNKPTLIVYGGTIMPGAHKMDVPGMNRKAGDRTQISDNYEALGAFLSGKINNEERLDMVRNSCPGPGSCGGMYTANTLSTCIEVMGMGLPKSSSAPAISAEKKQECARAGAVVKKLLELDLKPRDIMTKKAFENAITLVHIMGGSTNAVLHLIAAAKSADVDITVDDCEFATTQGFVIRC